MIGAGCGGIFNFQSDTTIFDCTFNANQAIARGGGGMCNNHMSDAIVSNCIFIGNSGEYGGGIANRESIVEVTNCVFLGNSGFFGGGLSSEINSDVTVTNCLFSGNSANSGAAMMLLNGSNPTLINCTFAGNSAANNGGGLRVAGGSNPTVDNCVFWDNSDDGPQDESAQISINVGDPAVTYTDIMGLTQPGPFCVNENGNPPCEGNIGLDPKFLGGASGDWSDNATFDPATGQTTFTDIGAGFGDLVDNFLNPDTAQPSQSLIVSNSATQIVVWGDFKDLGSKGTFYQINDYRLQPGPAGSPCIDAADNNAVTICSADLDGNERIVDDPATTDTGNGGFPFIDMGAYEFGGDPELDCDSLGIADSCCPEDFNGDGMVGAFDLAVLLGTWGACPGQCSPGDSTCECRADLDNNCEVKAFDLALLLGFWGPCP